jgi:hypothetical protein
MGPRDLVDRLPADRIRQRLPSVWEPADDSERTPAGEDLGDPELVVPEDGAGPFEDASDAESDEDGGGRLRRALLGVSVGSGLLAVVAAVVWRVLGRGDEPEDPPAEPAPERERDEGVAALVGLGFGLAVAALRRRFSSPTK